MPGGFSQQQLDEIRSRVDIVEIVGQSVKLKRAGENWKGLCPFHTEKTPSFTVNPKRNIYHCFGCGAGGDAFSFMMRQDRVAFPEAVRTLAERAGVALPTLGGRAPEADGRLEALRRVMALAAEFYTQSLWEQGGEKARAYLEQRGVESEVARRFGLGYAPESWNALLGAMARQGIGDDALVQAGLALARQNGPGFYDRFRGRLLFPIRDVQGRVVAFGGRALSGEEPKYLNSPETPLYVKGQTLYALDVAKSAIRDRSRAIIVEGYLDCLMAHQHGFGETVAALGTAFTEAQLGLLRRYTDEVIALFDADAAGEKASARLEEMMAGAMDLPNLGWSVTRTGSFERPALSKSGKFCMFRAPIWMMSPYCSIMPIPASSSASVTIFNPKVSRISAMISHAFSPRPRNEYGEVRGFHTPPRIMSAPASLTAWAVSKNRDLLLGSMVQWPAMTQKSPGNTLFPTRTR